MIQRCLLLVCCLVLLPALVSAATTMLLATDDTPGPPFIIGEGEKFQWENPGLEIEMYLLMAEKLEITIEFVRQPWKRCLLSLETGAVDGVFPASFKQERLRAGVYPMQDDRVNPEFKTRDNAYYFYQNKHSPLVWDGATLNPPEKDIYAPLGWAIVDDLRKMGIDNIKEIFDLTRAFDLLRAERISGFACLETVADFYLKENPEKYINIEKVIPALNEKPYYLMLSHQFVNKHPELAGKIWPMIAEVKKSVEYQEILKKYQHY